VKRSIQLEGGKYAVELDDDTAKMTFLRHGEPWPAGQEAFQYAGLVLAMAQELADAQEAVRSSVDYRALLVRYMAAVIDAESVSYVESCQGYKIVLTPEEKAELLKIETEACEVPSDHR